MKKDLDSLLSTIKKALIKVNSLDDVESLETKYLGRKGDLTKILRGIKDLSIKEKKILGSYANNIKKEIVELIVYKKNSFSTKTESSILDVTIPGQGHSLGTEHPLSKVQYELEDIFQSMGFMVLDGPELESDYYNFEALNIPANHPARDMQDTFFIQDRENLVMRTQTSAVQIRALEKYGAPLQAIVPGRCFRNEATDASHDATFDQVEGLMVGHNITIANLIAVMKSLLSSVFKKDVTIRLRPGYFPFVEPGFELDIQCLICKGNGKGCSVCNGSGWVELMPCGMVHPNVLKAGGVDTNEFTGFAFGLGLTRLVMMKYEIDDIRLILSGDLRFIKQF